MKTRYSSIIGLFAIVVLVASFVVPAKLVSPAPVDADPGLMEWTIVDTPDSEPVLTKNLYTTGELGSEIVQLLVGNDGKTMYAIVARGSEIAAADAGLQLLKSTNGGRSWSGSKYGALDAANPNSANADLTQVWRIAIAPDDPKIIAAAISTFTANPVPANLQEVWVSTDGGDNWDNTNWPPATGGPVAGDLISTMDISMEYGSRDMLVGTRDGTGTGINNLQTMKMPGYGGWVTQSTGGAPAGPNAFTGDVIVAKFSPTFVGDSTIAVVYTNGTATVGQRGTWLATGVHDLAVNTTTWQAQGEHIEIKNSGSTTGMSPRVNEIITADLALPSDFSGQSASLRRFYVSTDAMDRVVDQSPNRGIFRVDDNIVYTLMDNTSTFEVSIANRPNRRVSSIAYWGTYASGKLLVGEVLGQTCEATVPTWFTDSPTVCPVPCWYPAKKPTTGAAGEIVCNSNTTGYGNAQVAWSPTYADQGVAYVGTGAASMDGAYADPVENIAALAWPAGWFNVNPWDESAFALTRNNGETWNQLSLIDTRMTKLTDVAPSADCSTVYLASTNNGTNCEGFDSVWRSSTNEAVVAPPLPALPIGQIWERVRTSLTAATCNETTDPQSEYAILRLAPDKLDGQIVFWAAGGTSGLASISGTGDVAYPVGANTRAVAWSPDFGDYWADINPRIAVQDMAAESSTILYILSLTSQVQKMPYTGTAWSSATNSVSGKLGMAHTIEAQAEGKVLLGGSIATQFAAAISLNGASSFIPALRQTQTPATIGWHAIFDTDYDDNSVVYAASDGVGTGVVYRNELPAGYNSEWTDFYTNYAPSGHREFYGIVQTNSLNVSHMGTLYAAHEMDGGNTFSGVERTLYPLLGIPKPGTIWECMDASTFFQNQVANGPLFTLEPKSLKICGCLTQDTYATLWAIDNDWYANNHNAASGIGNIAAVRDRGMLWAYTDCVAKVGPTLTMEDGTIIGCDPATGRAQEVNFTWEQLCIATDYQIQIAKDLAFTMRVFDSGAFAPVTVTSPALVYLTTAGAGVTFPATTATSALECGHTYYWRARVRDETTNDAIRSPWSEKRGFTIKAGFRVTTPYYGPQLLAPDNGCGCPCDAPLCFSWSPFKESTAYKFELSENADMSSPLVSTTVSGATAFQYDGTAKCNTNYFWRVQSSEPAPSEWSAVFSFMTQAEDAPPPPPAPAPETPMWVWIIIALGAVLVIVTLVLIFKTRRA